MHTDTPVLASCKSVVPFSPPPQAALHYIHPLPSVFPSASTPLTSPHSNSSLAHTSKTEPGTRERTHPAFYSVKEESRHAEGKMGEEEGDGQDWFETRGMA